LSDFLQQKLSFEFPSVGTGLKKVNGGNKQSGLIYLCITEEKSIYAKKDLCISHHVTFYYSTKET
jgi:hypothetical protein